MLKSVKLLLTKVKSVEKTPKKRSSIGAAKVTACNSHKNLNQFIMQEKNIEKIVGAADDYLINKVETSDNYRPLMRQTITTALTESLYDNLLYKVEEGIANLTGAVDPLSDCSYDNDYDRLYDQIFETVNKKLFKQGGKTIRKYNRGCKITMGSLIAVNPNYTPQKKTVSPWLFHIMCEIKPIE